MSDPNAIDGAVLAPYLEQNVDGFSGFRAIDKFSSGQSNPTYKITADSGTYVLRAKPPGKLLKSAHQVDREFRVINALGKTGVPVPKVFHLSEEDSPIGRMFYVMEFLDGRILWDPALPEISSNEERSAIYDSMNEALAALHCVDVEAVGLGDFGKPGSYFERQFSRWSSQYRASEVDAVPAMDAIIDWLGENMITDDGRVSLVHGDYRLDNMVFAHDSAEILAILDWELSTLGHPYADLAYQCMQWRMPHDSGFRGLGGVDRKAIGLPTEREYVASYCARTGAGGIDNWAFYLVFSFFRLGAIVQGVYKRSLDGNASNPQKAKAYGMAVPLLAGLAANIIEKEA